MTVERDTVITDEIRSLVGQELDVRTSDDEVTATEIRRFAQAVMDENPVYYDAAAAAGTRFGGLVAPGPFPYHYTRRRPLGVPDPMTTLPPDWDGEETPFVHIPWPEGYVYFHGGDELEVRQLARPGERITSTTRIVDAYEKEGRSGRLGFVVRETVFTNDTGEVLCINRHTSVARKVR